MESEDQRYRISKKCIPLLCLTVIVHVVSSSEGNTTLSAGNNSNEGLCRRNEGSEKQSSSLHRRSIFPVILCSSSRWEGFSFCQLSGTNIACWRLMSNRWLCSALLILCCVECRMPLMIRSTDNVLNSTKFVFGTKHGLQHYFRMKKYP